MAPFFVETNPCPCSKPVENSCNNKHIEVKFQFKIDGKNNLEFYEKTNKNLSFYLRKGCDNDREGLVDK